MQIKKSIILFFVINLTLTYPLAEKYDKHYVVILDPAGDAKHTGRRIGDSFERGLTLQCAEKIKEYVEINASHIKIVITRVAGDSVYDFQNASLANRIGDFFINLNFYYTQETKPTVYLYQFSYGNDFVSQSDNCLQLYHYDQAYLINKHTSGLFGQCFNKELSEKKWQSLFFVTTLYKIPIKPLIGITIPSISIEAGLKSKESWHFYSEPIALAIIAAINELRE